jgi:hypothetical protein
MPGRPYVAPPPFNSAAGHFIDMPSASIDERGLGDVAPGDHPLGLAQEALRGLRLAVEGAYKSAVAIHADITLPEGARHLMADSTSFKICQRALPVIDHALVAMKTEIAKLKLKISAPVPDTTVKGISLASEIRQVLKSMAAGERRTAVAKAISTGDALTICSTGTVARLTARPPPPYRLASQLAVDPLPGWRVHTR